MDGVSAYEREQRAMHLRKQIDRAVVNAERQDRAGNAVAAKGFRETEEALRIELAAIDTSTVPGGSRPTQE